MELSNPDAELAPADLLLAHCVRSQLGAEKRDEILEKEDFFSGSIPGERCGCQCFAATMNVQIVLALQSRKQENTSVEACVGVVEGWKLQIRLNNINSHFAVSPQRA